MPPSAPALDPRPAVRPRKLSKAKRSMDFVMRCGAALHQFGVPANRLEPLLAQVARGLSLDGTFFVEPTSLQASFATERGPETRFARVQPGADDLGRLAALDDLATRLGSPEHPISLTQAERQLDRILEAPRQYPVALELFGFALASTTAARLFGGGPNEWGGAAIAGGLTGVLAWWSQRHPSTAPIFEGTTAFLVALAGATAAAAGLPIAVDLTVLAGLIVLIPGLTLTLAVTELATRHLASGVARLASAGVSFGAITFGVVMAQKLAEALYGAPSVPLASVTHLPEPWTLWLAVALAPWGFAVILRAAPRDLPFIAVAGPIAYLGTRAGAAAVGPELGAFVGAALVTAGSNLLARWRQRPASITLVPGILVLVPGSLGFRSFAALMHHDWHHGLQSAIQMVTVALALVAGLLVAGVLLPSRRAL